MLNEENVEAAARLLIGAKSAIFFTGAGVSKESGIPTFRDAQTGLWANYDPEELATPTAFRRNPNLVWQWYDERRKKLTEVQPNPGHYAIAEFQNLISKVVVVTQNVDGLHKEAGSRSVIELHGNIREFFCFDRRHECPAENVPLGLKAAPKCHCGSLIRPAVVWFHEALPEDALERTQSEILQTSVLFVVGTSSLVQPAASLPALAMKNSIPVVEINPDETPLSHRADLVIRSSSGKAVPEILAAYKNLITDKK